MVADVAETTDARVLGRAVDVVVLASSFTGGLQLFAPGHKSKHASDLKTKQQKAIQEFREKYNLKDGSIHEQPATYKRMSKASHTGEENALCVLQARASPTRW